MTILTSRPTAGEETPAQRPELVSPVLLVTATLLALLLIALLNCDQLVRLAERMPYGSDRTTALQLANADKNVSHAVLLDRPRQTFDRLFGHARAGSAGPEPSISASPAPLPSPTSSEPVPATPAPPSAAHPLRVFLGGDSIGIDVAQALQSMATRSKVVSFDSDAKISTGLTRPDYFNWPARLRQVLANAQPPRVVIMMVGENDIQPILTPTGPAAFGTASWRAEYRRRVAATMAMLTGRGADVYWIGQPQVESAETTRQLGQLDAIFAAEAASHPGVTFIDSRPLLSDAHGNYAEYLPGPHGSLVQVRWGDGIHLTPAGAARIAVRVWSAMRQQWRLPAFT